MDSLCCERVKCSELGVIDIMNYKTVYSGSDSIEDICRLVE